MDEIQIDPELRDTLKAIREGVRILFEQLRLKHEAGDMTGKERLERVPALAKRNFANLGSTGHIRAAKEAWRLIDFLEGRGQGQLSPLAREGLRVVELDKRLAALRASDSWKEAAARLRESLGVAPFASRPGPEASAPAPAPPAAPREPAPPAHAGSLVLPKLWPRLALASAALVAVAAGVAAALAGRGPDPRLACIPLESASERDLALHRELSKSTRPPRPKRSEGQRQTVPISDRPGEPVQSTWTTSHFSYAEREGPSTPGGGKSDLRLRVGGHGDTYLSLLQVPVVSDRMVQRAVVELTVLDDRAPSRPTTMSLRAISDSWEVAPGPKNRLWWRDCPRSEAVTNRLPKPGPPGSAYSIEITDLYNDWASGLHPANGIMLEPEEIGSWGDGRPDYASFNTFYSTRARDAANRPRLVLDY